MAELDDLVEEAMNPKPKRDRPGFKKFLDAQKEERPHMLRPLLRQLIEEFPAHNLSPSEMEWVKDEWLRQPEVRLTYLSDENVVERFEKYSRNR